MAAEDKLTTLYNWSEAMVSAGEKVKEKHEKEYISIIDSVKSSDTKEKLLAAQLISRFFKYFPSFEETAFESIVDLCESADINVRKHATMAIITICRDCKHLVSKAADILIQLYQSNQPSEVHLINQSLTTLLNLDVELFLRSFFTNFEDGSEVVRERALKFLASKIHTLGENVLTKEIEEKLLTFSKKAMEDVTKDEFLTFINMLTKLKIAKTATGQAMIVLVVKSQAELDKEFEHNNNESIDKLLLCAKLTIPLLSQYNRSSEYIQCIVTKIIPHLSALEERKDDLNMLQALAEMSPFIHSEDIGKTLELKTCQQIILDTLMKYLPASNEGGEQDFQFTHIEYLLYTFHQLGRLEPFFTEIESNLLTRLRLLFDGCTKYTQILGKQVQLTREDNLIRSVALRTTKNIIVMVRDLFKKPPAFGATSVLLSCKPLAKPVEVLKKHPSPTNVGGNQQRYDPRKRMRSST